MAVNDTGKCHSFIFLHGFAGSTDSWSDVLEALPKNSKVLRLSPLGHGDGSQEGLPLAQENDSYSSLTSSFTEEVDRLAAEIRQKGFQGSHLVGYSLGGRLSLGLLVRHTADFSRATLIGTHPGLREETQRLERALQDETWSTLLEMEGLETFLDRWESQPLFATQNEAQRRRQRRQREHLDPHGLALAMRRLSLAQMPNYWPELPRLSLPVQWISGDQDPKFRRLARVAAAAHDSGDFKEITAAGHNIPLEQPAPLAALLSEDHSLEQPKPDTTFVMEGIPR